MTFDLITLYIGIGFFVSILNYLYRTMMWKSWTPKFYHLSLWVSIWPVVAFFLVMDASLTFLDNVADSDIWTRRKDD